MLNFIVVVVPYISKWLHLLFENNHPPAIFFLSFLRFMVFILQYLILLKVMDVQIGGMLSFWVLTIFYLVMVLAPTIGFTELPVRATASVAILGLYSTNVLGIQAATFGIWLINLVLPALIGSIFILGVKIMKEK